MLKLTHFSLATTEELFQYKYNNFKLPEFPGYTQDQWGIKAHNRPWIDDVGEFDKGQKIIEVGGAYSTLPEYLSKKYQLEAWVGDSFINESNKGNWSRWGGPENLSEKNQNTKYVFENFGSFSTSFKDRFFSLIFKAGQSCKLS
jgi:hypothetical protein